MLNIFGMPEKMMMMMSRKMIVEKAALRGVHLRPIFPKDVILRLHLFWQLLLQLKPYVIIITQQWEILLLYV